MAVNGSVQMQRSAASAASYASNADCGVPVTWFRSQQYYYDTMESHSYEGSISAAAPLAVVVLPFFEVGSFWTFLTILQMF